MRNSLIAAAAVFMLTACGILAPIVRAAETFDWSGEFVALDEASRSVTVKARLLDETAIADVKQLKPGDRALLVWSGMTFSDAIRRVVPLSARAKADGELLSSVEVVSTDVASHYLTFRARVPVDGVLTLKPLKAGNWVTATSLRASRDGAAIVSIRPYSTVRSASTSS